jgi:uncharacterized protein YjiS (DUF1127 family)
MTSAIEYSVIWAAANDKAKLDAVSANLQQVVAQAHAQRAAMIAGAFAAVGSKLTSAMRRFAAAQKRRSAAAQLLAMDDRMLRDIGLTRAEVPMVVCGLATGETPDVLANTGAFDRATQANENRSNRAA